MLQNLITDIIPLALLVMFFGIQQRGRRQVYYRFWFAGWICVLFSYVLYAAENRGPVQDRLMEAARLDLLIVASLLFMTSFLTSIRCLRHVVLTGLPVGLLIVFMMNLLQLHYAVPRAAMVVTVLAWQGYGFYAAQMLLSGDKNRRRWLIQAVCVVFGVGLSVALWRTGTADLSQWAQVEIFLSAAVLYGVAHRRGTTAGILATIGFTLWAMVYTWDITAHYFHLSVQPFLQHTYWILPKFLVTFAMVLKIFEDAQDEKNVLVEQYRTLYDEFRTMYENHPAATWVFEQESGRLLSVNRAAVRRYGFSREEFATMTAADLTEMDDTDLQLIAKLHPNAPDTILRHRYKDGTKVWVGVLECAVSFQGHKALLMQAHDITDKIESAQRHEHQSGHDELTGLPNRRLLEDRMHLALQRSTREGKKTAVFAIDIDHFKKVNDTFGHLVGDECLKAVAARLDSKIRSIDTLARTGGEEFVAVIGGLSSGADAGKIAHGLLQLFEPPLQLPECDLAVTISIGLAVFPDDGYDAETLYKLSDEALYAAKRNGRNRVETAGTASTTA